MVEGGREGGRHIKRRQHSQTLPRKSDETRAEEPGWALTQASRAVPWHITPIKRLLTICTVAAVALYNMDGRWVILYRCSFCFVHCTSLTCESAKKTR